MNFIKRHETAILKISLGIIVAGFLGSIQWQAMARAMGLL